MAIHPFDVLRRHYSPGPLLDLLVVHSVLVAAKARRLAEAYREGHPDAAIDLEFLTEAALLHDIGIGRCDAPEIHCRGGEPYIRHGVLGREMLEREGLPRHALVCERHTGAGISAADVAAQGLPLPARDLLPESLEEKLICVADKFYSKTPAKLWKEKSVERIRKGMERFGPEAVARWEALEREIIGSP
jgi:uncharacterized protein